MRIGNQWILQTKIFRLVISLTRARLQLICVFESPWVTGFFVSGECFVYDVTSGSQCCARRCSGRGGRFVSECSYLDQVSDHVRSSASHLSVATGGRPSRNLRLRDGKRGRSADARRRLPAAIGRFPDLLCHSCLRRATDLLSANLPLLCVYLLRDELDRLWFSQRRTWTEKALEQCFQQVQRRGIAALQLSAKRPQDYWRGIPFLWFNCWAQASSKTPTTSSESSNSELSRTATRSAFFPNSTPRSW